MPIHASPDTRRALGGAGFKDCDSRSLWKDKFVFFDSAFDEAKRVALDLYLPKGRYDVADLRNSNKGWTAVRGTQLAKKAEANANNNPFNANQLDKATAALAATAAFVASIPKPILNARDWLTSLPTHRCGTFQLQTVSRLLVGLANGVLENGGCTLHPLFGFPIIPGAALKAISRDAAAVLGKSKEEIHQNFGGEPGDDDHIRQGDVSFLDAHALLVPDQVDLELDIVTPHFQKYYGGTGNPEARDEEPPIPSVFPAVCVGVTFEFALIIHTQRLDDGKAVESLALAKECLVYGLTQLGVGAKTAAGYGRFTTDVAKNVGIRQDLFPPPPRPVLSPEDQVRANWQDKPVNSFNVKYLIDDLALITDDFMLATVFDQVIPAPQLTNFRAANLFWAAFLQKGGKPILDRINRQLLRR